MSKLIFSGEEQLCNYPGLTRGLVSVLLYFDGRKSLVQSLRTLIQARSGLTWTLELSEDVSELVSQFTQQLLEEGMVEKILGEDGLVLMLLWTAVGQRFFRPALRARLEQGGRDAAEEHGPG